MSRQIALKLTRQTQEPITLPALVRTLDSLQKVLLQIGEMHHDLALSADEQTRPQRGGQFRNVIRAACELQVVNLAIGSAEAVLELPPADPNLFTSDLGMQALTTTRELTTEITNGASWGRIHELLPVEASRSLILNSYGNLCPTRGEETVVNLWDPSDSGRVYQLRPEVRARVRLIGAQAAPEDVLEERQLIGTINILQADPDQYSLRLPDGGQFRVSFDPELREEYRPLWGERVIVNAICRVILHDEEDDTIVEIRDVVEVTPVDDSPLEVSAIPLAAARVALREPLQVAPTFSDNLVNFEYEPLGIVAYGRSREEAEQAFRDELTWLWEEYASAPDESLAEDARQLKRRLHELVEGAYV